MKIRVEIVRFNLIILGRDARPSGKWISKLIIKILIEKGINVIDLGLSTTPSIGIYVKTHQASGGIIISASHNSIEWNAKGIPSGIYFVRIENQLKIQTQKIILQK